MFDEVTDNGMLVGATPDIMNTGWNRIMMGLDETVHIEQSGAYDIASHVVPFTFGEPLFPQVVDRMIEGLAQRKPNRAGYGAQMSRTLRVSHLVVSRPLTQWERGIGTIHYTLTHGIGD